jgi:branched-chain amino acid transport system ATP-binding protein
MSSILKVENVTMQFGGVVAVDNLNLEVNEGEIVPSSAPTAPAKPLPST